MTIAETLELFSDALLVHCKHEDIGYVLILLGQQGENVAAHAATDLPPALLLDTLRKYVRTVEEKVGKG